jgi:hypothetical protein
LFAGRHILGVKDARSPEQDESLFHELIRRIEKPVRFQPHYRIRVVAEFQWSFGELLRSCCTASQFTDTFTDSGQFGASYLLPHTRLKMTVEKRPTGAALKVTLERHRTFLAFERRCRPYLPRCEFGSVRNPARIVLDEAAHQIGGDSGVNLIRMWEGLEHVNVMKDFHLWSPPLLRKAELWRAASAFHIDDWAVRKHFLEAGLPAVAGSAEAGASCRTWAILPALAFGSSLFSVE